MELPRQEYWSELPFPTPRDLPDQGIEPTSVSPALAGGLFIRVTWEAPIYFIYPQMSKMLSFQHVTNIKIIHEIFYFFVLSR